MADFADIASGIEAESLRVALENHKAKQPAISRHFCEECGNVIPEARRAVIHGVTRCVDCQELHERKCGGWMNYGSVCSGIEAASVAWRGLGWQAAWFAEIEPFPCAVLAHHYPNVPNLGDMTKIAKRVLQGKVAAPDVLVGGTPCQAYSVAGLREGLDDPRGQLTLSYMRLADAIDFIRRRNSEPECIIVWENVPGVLSDKTNAFGCFLAGLAGENCELQPPRGKWSNAGCVFGPSRTVAWRVLDAQYFGLAQRRRRVFVVASARSGFDPAAVLFECDGVRRDFAPSRKAGQDTAGTLASRTRAGGFPGTDEACSGYVQPVAGTLEASAGRSRRAGTPPAMLTPVICMAHGQGGAEIASERSPTLTCNHEAPIAVHGTQDPCVRRLTPRECERLQGTPDDYTLIPFGRIIRIEKLEADWVKYLLRGGVMTLEQVCRAAADGPRYKALGNSMAVPVMEWLGKRIQREVAA